MFPTFATNFEIVSIYDYFTYIYIHLEELQGLIKCKLT